MGARLPVLASSSAAVWVLVVVLALPSGAQTLPAGYHEELRLEVTNQAGAPVRVSRDQGQSWVKVATVVSGCQRVNPRGFRASSWVPPSSVAATAVNAIHLKIANDPQTGRAAIFSLIPRGTREGDILPEAAIVLDTPPGLGVFGGLGPTVGSPVYLARSGRAEVAAGPEDWQRLPPDYLPAPGDRLLMVRMVPDRALRYLDFENIFGGRILATYRDGGQEVIGHVLAPVTGIGRFEGTRDADVGRLRANHAGVIDVSTSPYGMVGGFQIIPWDHANDSEMFYVRTNHQWLVVGPANMNEGRASALAPLFFGTLYPSWRPDDLEHEDACARLLSRCMVLCQTAPSGVAPLADAGTLGADGVIRRWPGLALSDRWELLPAIAFSKEVPPDSPSLLRGRLLLIHEPPLYRPLPPMAQTCLAGIVAFRISLPEEIFWPGEAEGARAPRSGGRSTVAHVAH